MKTLRNEIHAMGREEYAVYALEKFNAEHVDDFMTGSCDLGTFRDLWDNHHTMAELDNGVIICVPLKMGSNRRLTHNADFILNSV